MNEFQYRVPGSEWRDIPLKNMIGDNSFRFFCPGLGKVVEFRIKPGRCGSEIEVGTASAGHRRVQCQDEANHGPGHWAINVAGFKKLEW